MKRLKINCKAVDDDSIQPKMLKNAGHFFRTSLLDLVNKAFFEGHWPWNKSKAIFLRKPDKTNYSEPSSYRLITISRYVGNIAERLIEARIRGYLQVQNPLKNLEGFSNMKVPYGLYSLKTKTQMVKMEKQVGVLTSVDFEKTFDSIWIK